MRIMNRVELLAPAGGYETMVGAFNAGADAVYLGGSKFGARAYADNFDMEQVLDAISYAHLHHKKIYMTVNTLVKEREFSQLYDYMLPFAQQGLDGVIVQDLGVMKFIRDEFPDVELHASTQQTVTGVHGARLLKELGCCRVVPARELSLMEMKAIREQADVEVEAFIHGAMCYCYSGMCLFSSMVGTRSGNRGRCAQPCRLPYRFEDDRNELYPLSLKDMCTIGIIPELIEAGINSFKIEGRMKKPEYAAGVTAIYRKYIDKYYADPKAPFKVSKEDQKEFEGLYQRTGISEGYYHKHNGRDMVTIESPAYNKTSEETLLKVKEKYLTTTLKIKCNIKCLLTLSKEARLSMSVNYDGQVIEREVIGNVVSGAMKRPMDEESVLKQISKLGGTSFEAQNIEVVIDDNGTGTGIFIPVGELNDLRRRVCEEMEEALLNADSKNSEDVALNGYSDVSDNESGIASTTKSELSDGNDNSMICPGFNILVNTKKQLGKVVEMYKGTDLSCRLYVDSNIFLSMDEYVEKELDAFKNDATKDVTRQLLVALPYMTRKEKFDATRDLQLIADTYKAHNFDGILVRNLEQLGFFKEISFDGLVVLDYSMYVWNKEAAALLTQVGRDGSFVKEISVPLELTIHEAKETFEAVKDETSLGTSIMVYGRVPMMISAGCVKKTMDKCSGRMNEIHSEKVSITDRMNNRLSVVTNCRNCYNVIYNVHPTSLYKKMDQVKNAGLFDQYRIDFTTENEFEVSNVIKAYVFGDEDAARDILSKDYTLGHYKRGVE